MQCCVLDTLCLSANPQLCGRPVRGLDVRNISGLSLEWMQWTRVENGCVSPVLLFVLLRPNYFSFYLKSVIRFQALILPYFSWIGKRLFLFWHYLKLTDSRYQEKKQVLDIYLEIYSDNPFWGETYSAWSAWNFISLRERLFWGCFLVPSRLYGFTTVSSNFVNFFLIKLSPYM